MTLDIVDAVVREIDVRTKQVLIEAFVVEADKTFSKGLGSRIAAMTNRKDSSWSTWLSTDSIQSGGIGGAATTPGSYCAGRSCRNGIQSRNNFSY
jgi:type IV pilus assembly protein PilQ